MSERAAAPFSRMGALGLLLVGFGAFLAILYFLAMGDTGPENSQNGKAHAASKALNGYSALVDLVEADGFDVAQSREQSALTTDDLLVLTPPHNADAQDLADVIDAREYLGPTLVILPKWGALSSGFLEQVEDPEEVQEGWVVLSGTGVPIWANQEDGLLALKVTSDGNLPAHVAKTPPAGEQKTNLADRPNQQYATTGQIAGVAGALPSSTSVYANPEQPHTPLVVDQKGRTIALSLGEPSAQDSSAQGGFEDDFEDEVAEANWVVFVIEPDLMNNWGLADPGRAQTALSIIRLMGDDYYDRVVFDLTLNGFGGAMNLLTLAFQPPFLAATICLILALFVLGWRSFLRFGPAAAPERETAFGKAGLVTNGADLILRAGRLNLLAEPYIKLSEQRMTGAGTRGHAGAGSLGTGASLDGTANASLSSEADTMRRASKPADILRAARALYQKSQDT